MAKYDGLTSMNPSQEAFEHLGGNMREGDPFTFAPTVWKYMIDRFAVQSVLDLGSGTGYAADWFDKSGVKTLAVEGFHENVINSKYPSFLLDLEKGFVTTRVDLCHCQEVVEHIKEEYKENLMKTMICGEVVLMTHAVPGQSGHHHVNLQPAEYWINEFKAYGYHLLSEDTDRIRKLAKLDGAIFLMNTGMIFHSS